MVITGFPAGSICSGRTSWSFFLFFFLGGGGGVGTNDDSEMRARFFVSFGEKKGLQETLNQADYFNGHLSFNFSCLEGK